MARTKSKKQRGTTSAATSATQSSREAESMADASAEWPAVREVLAADPNKAGVLVQHLASVPDLSATTRDADERESQRAILLCASSLRSLDEELELQQDAETRAASEILDLDNVAKRWAERRAQLSLMATGANPQEESSLALSFPWTLANLSRVPVQSLDSADMIATRTSGSLAAPTQKERSTMNSNYLAEIKTLKSFIQPYSRGFTQALESCQESQDNIVCGIKRGDITRPNDFMKDLLHIRQITAAACAARTLREELAYAEMRVDFVENASRVPRLFNILGGWSDQIQQKATLLDKLCASVYRSAEATASIPASASSSAPTTDATDAAVRAVFDKALKMASELEMIQYARSEKNERMSALTEDGGISSPEFMAGSVTMSTLGEWPLNKPFLADVMYRMHLSVLRQQAAADSGPEMSSGGASEGPRSE